MYGLGTVTVVKASGPHVNLSRSKLSRLCVCVSLIGKRDGHRSRFECPEGVENVSLRWTIVIYTSANVKLIARNTTYTYNTSCSSCILRHAIVQGGRGKAVPGSLRCRRIGGGDAPTEAAAAPATAAARLAPLVVVVLLLLLLLLLLAWPGTRPPPCIRMPQKTSELPELRGRLGDARKSLKKKA